MKKQIVFNDFSLLWQEVRKDTLRAIDRVGKNGQYILGEEVKSFEKKLAEFWGLPYAVTCGNGLDAIEICLRCLNLKPEQKVITTPLSAFATSLAILRAGGQPVFVDTDQRGLIDLEKVEQMLQKNPDIRFLVPVHLYGYALNLKRLKQLKHTYGLTIVEDCAQAIGAKSHNRPVGSVGDMAAVSFYPTKNLGCIGDGGAVLTKQAKFARLAKYLRSYGDTEKYHHKYLGLNSRLDEIQAAILKIRLRQLPKRLRQRQKIARRYGQEINHSKITIPSAPDDSDSSWHLFPVLIKGSRRSFQMHLKKAGVPTLIHYPKLIPQQPAIRQANIFADLTNASTFARQEVSLPIHPYLNDSQVERIILACNTWKK